MEDKELTQWEYKEVPPGDINEKNLNELGKQGWEATAVEGGGTILLKRPIIKDKK